MFSVLTETCHDSEKARMRLVHHADTYGHNADRSISSCKSVKHAVNESALSVLCQQLFLTQQSYRNALQSHLPSSSTQMLQLAHQAQNSQICQAA